MRSAIGAITFGLALAATPATAKTVVVRAAHMVDVLAGRTVDNVAVVITDGRITAIGKAGDAVPAGAETIDLGARTLLLRWAVGLSLAVWAVLRYTDLGKALRASAEDAAVAAADELAVV